MDYRPTREGLPRFYIEYYDAEGERKQELVKSATSWEEAIAELQKRDQEKKEKQNGKQNIGFRNSRLNKGNTKSTINRDVALLKRMFKVAIDENYLDVNPAAKVKMYSERDNLREKILTIEEEERLFKASSVHLRPILTTALLTGMRKGEILNLKWKNADLKCKEIRVENTKASKVVIVPMNSERATVLEGLRKKNNGSEFVFLNPKTGKPFQEVKTAFKGACRRAGIDGLRFHDTRHTFATRLVSQGVDIVTVKSLLGHSTVRVTERYTHSSSKQKREAVERLAEIHGQVAKEKSNLLHICYTEALASKGEDSSKVLTNLLSRN